MSTWQHVCVLGDEVRVPSDEGKEDPGVGGPGDEPDGQQGEASSPQPPLSLESLFTDVAVALLLLFRLLCSAVQPALEVVVSVEADDGEV